MPDRMSAKSPPPGSPMTPCANACPRPVLPRWFARRTANPASARTTPFGSDSEKYVLQHQLGPPWTAAMSGSGPVAPRGRHQPALDLEAVRSRPAHRPGVRPGRVVGHERVVERRQADPVTRGRIEAGDLGRDAVRLMGGEDRGRAVAHRALRLDDVPADERVPGPDLVATAVEPDPARGGPEAVGPRVPERIGIAPGRQADRLEARPGICDRPVLEVDDLDAAAEQARVARVALDDRRATCVGRHGQSLEVPGRLVQGSGGPACEVDDDEPRVVPAVAAGCVRDDRDDRRIVEQVELPDAVVRRADLLDDVGLEVDGEQASP